MAEHHDVFTSALETTIGDDELFGQDAPCPIRTEGENSRIVLITGPNAGGKSFFARALSANVSAQRDTCNIEYLPVSMGIRTMQGMHRVFMYGEEGRDSTGRISLRAVLGGLKTCRGREGPHMLLLDEPDVGLSDSYQRALGELLCGFAKDLPDNTSGLILVTHSRPLAAEFMQAKPTCIRVGEDLRPTATWIREGDLPRTVEDVETLAERSAARMRAIQAVLNERQQARASAAPRP
jgi:ATPase subunit of ABC transporter with duplicated ATPase domains